MRTTLFAITCFLSSGIRPGLAQEAAATADTTTDTAGTVIPDLAGKWTISQPLRPTFPVTIEQENDRLKLVFKYEIKCNGQGFYARTEMEGSVSGDRVRLRATDGRIEGDFRNECAASSIYVGREDFLGKLSADGKKIVGPSDHSNRAAAVWTFTRVPRKGEKN